MARSAGKSDAIWVADDVKIGKWTSFPRSVKLRRRRWCSSTSCTRAHRDRVNAMVMKDPRLAKMMDPQALLFDGKRMTYGGFRELLAFG
jgi:uncharacterized protein YbaA (DUF1428 family)